MNKGSKTAYRAILVGLLSLTCQLSFGQMFRQSSPVTIDRENSLLAQLNLSRSDKSRMEVLLKLSNLYLDKPFKLFGNLDKGIRYAQDAAKLGNEIHDIAGYNNAQQLNMILLMEKDSIEATKRLLVTVNDTTKVNVLLLLSHKLLIEYTTDYMGNARKAIVFAQKASLLARQYRLKYKDNLASIYIGLGHSLINKQKLAKVELDSAFKLALQTNSTNLQYAYFAMACFYSNDNNTKETLSAAFKALSYAKAAHNNGFLSTIYFFLGQIYEANDQSEIGLENVQESIKYCKLYRSDIYINYAICEVARRYIAARQFNKALNYLNFYKNKYPSDNYEDKLAVIRTFADCYLKLKKNDLAEQYFIKEFNIQKDAKQLTFDSYERMAYFYVEIKQYKKARLFLSLADNVSTDITFSERAHLQYMIFLADSAAGNYLSAINHLNLNRAYHDSSQHKVKMEATQKLIIGYETNKKSQQIKLLQAKEKLQTANIKEAAFVKRVTNCGILVMLVGGILFYVQYRRKQRDSLVISKKNAQLGKLLVEKEWLLKEVHHRVKNNLHTVMCLLEIQSEFLKDDALKAIENSQHRIYAMSLIHQKLYMSDDVKTINMADYVPELIHYLKDSFGNKKRIGCELNIQPVHLDVGQAVPLGLIINEAVTNSIKYAFPDAVEGTISITMSELNGEVSLVIADDGIGFLSKVEDIQRKSLGLKLIMGLGEDINAQITITGQQGTKISISFTPGMLNEIIIDEEAKVS